MSATFVVSVHDVAPASAGATRRWLDDLDLRGIPATLLVIPGAWRGPALREDPSLVAELHAAARRGHELSLHGYAHTALPGGSAWRRRTGQVAARGAAEFCALSRARAALLIRKGIAELADAGIVPTGFTPPGWLASPGTVDALRDAGMRYWTSHLAVHDLARNRRTLMPALSHRPGGFGQRLGAAVVTGGARRLAGAGRPFRIALHPDDLLHPELRAATLTAIDTAIGAGMTAHTYASVVGA